MYTEFLNGNYFNLFPFQVKGTGAPDSGLYRVTAENPAGADSASFDVNVRSKFTILRVT